MKNTYFKFYSVILLLFAALACMLCWYSRLATDDYYFISDVRANGIITGVTSQYMEWCGRYAATFVMDVFFKYLDVNQTYYFLVPLLSFIMLITGLQLLINTISKYYNLIIEPKIKWIANLSFVALLFFLSFSIGETWFWYCCVSSYLWSIIALIWGLGFLFYKRNKFVSFLGILICFIYIGGSSEVYSVIYGVVLTYFLIKEYRKSSGFKSFIKEGFNKKLLFLYFTLAIAFIIFLIAPGNYLRDGLFPQHQFFFSFFRVAKSIIKISIVYLPSVIPAIIVFSVPFILLGKMVKQNNPNLFTVSFRTLFLRITKTFIFLTLLFLMIVAYVMVETGPPRMMFLFSFMLVVYLIIISFYAGYTNLVNEERTSVLKISSIILGMIMLIYNISVQYLISKKYTTSLENRITYITDLNKKIKKDTLIRLPPLAPSGMLYSAEIMGDTTHFTNQELKLGYKLKYHVIRGNEETKNK